MEINLTWKKMALGTTVASAMMVGAAFVGARLALATPGGETRNALSFAGTLRTAAGAPVTAATTLTFTFRKGSTTVCAPMTTATPDSAGAFVAQIPIDACPRSLFDGSDVVFDVASGSNVIARDQAVNPVPYARYADTVGTPDCPATYARDASAAGIVLCRRGNDEIVRVGSGNSAFWIDRYEASVWSDPGGSRGVLDSPTTPFGASADDYPTTFPDNGQHTAPLFALSRGGVTPSRNITWFQASEACALSGKRLPRNEEWQLAARGTVDPGQNDGGANARCNTWLNNIRPTGRGGACVSAAGAQDMIGNLVELVAEWYLAPGATTSPVRAWGETAYNGDESYYITSGAINNVGFQSGLPAILARGGHFNDGTAAGLFKLEAPSGPSRPGSNGGFRCVVPR